MVAAWREGVDLPRVLANRSLQRRTTDGCVARTVAHSEHAVDGQLALSGVRAGHPAERPQTCLPHHHEPRQVGAAARRGRRE